MSVFDSKSYKHFLRDWVEEHPRGELSRMAEALRVSPALVSQVVNGDKHLSPELAIQFADHMALGKRETDFFLLLVDFERAGSHRLRELLRERIERDRNEAQKISNRISTDHELNSETRATYYSSWTYTGVRNLTAIPGYGNAEVLAEKLGLPKAVVARVVEFLLENNLCRLDSKGALTYGPSWTHVGADSRLVVKHHQNWRVRALTKMEELRAENLFFTSPMSMSVETADSIRTRLLDVISEVQAEVKPSPSEVVRCFNLDWFEY